MSAVSENLEPMKKKEKRRAKKRDQVDDPDQKQEDVQPNVIVTEKTLLHCAFCDGVLVNISFGCSCGENIEFKNFCEKCDKNVVKTCSKCKKEYVSKTKISLSTHRCNYFFDILLGTFTVFCFAFLLAPLDILAATSLKPYLPNQEFHLYQNGMPGDDVWMSNLMFPGANILLVPDIFYVVVLSLAYFVLVCGPCHESNANWFSELSYWKKRLFSPLIICGALAFHGLGNIHYQFWCSTSVIPKENCFAVFNWKSFQMWLSGLIIVGVCFFCVVGLVKLFKWLFITKKHEIVIRPLPKD